VVYDGGAGAQCHPIADGGPHEVATTEMSADDGLELADFGPDCETVSRCGGYAGGCAGALLNGEEASPADVM